MGQMKPVGRGLLHAPLQGERKKTLQVLAKTGIKLNFLKVLSVSRRSEARCLRAPVFRFSSYRDGAARRVLQWALFSKCL